MMIRFLAILLAFFIVLWTGLVNCRRHHLELNDDERNIIQISTFGFLKGGFLSVQLNKLVVKPNTSINSGLIGFTVDQTLNDGLNPYSQNIDSSYCALSDSSTKINGQPLARLILTFDFKEKVVNCSKGLERLQIYRNITELPFALSSLSSSHQADVARANRDIGNLDGYVQIVVTTTNISEPRGEVTPKSQLGPVYSTDGGVPNQGNRYDEASSGNPDVHNQNTPFQVPGLDASNLDSGNDCKNYRLPLVSKYDGEEVSYSTSFVVYFPLEELEGLYNLYFHNCLAHDTLIDLDINIVEVNKVKNFLSAGEIHAPELSLVVPVVFYTLRFI